MIKRITAKLGNMRKAQDWVVYPGTRQHSGRDGLLIQCNNRIAWIDLAGSGFGVLSDGRGGHQGFHKLDKRFGARAIVVPADVLEAAKAAQPQSGDTIGSGVVKIA